MLHSGGEGGFKRVMDLLGLGDGIATVVGEAEMGVPLADHELELVRQVPAALRTRPRDEWVELLHAADIAAVAVHRPGEPLFDDQVEFAGLCRRRRGPRPRSAPSGRPADPLQRRRARAPSAGAGSRRRRRPDRRAGR